MSDLMEKEKPLTAVISLVVRDEVIVDRLSKRRVNRVTGENYHLDFKPVPDYVNPDHIIQRKDDRPDAIRKRLEIYRKETHPVEDWFRARGLLVEVSGEGSFEEVYARIVQAVQAAI
jgi:adenylate kinase